MVLLILIWINCWRPIFFLLDSCWTLGVCNVYDDDQLVFRYMVCVFCYFWEFMFFHYNYHNHYCLALNIFVVVIIVFDLISKEKWMNYSGGENQWMFDINHDHVIKYGLLYMSIDRLTGIFCRMFHFLPKFQSFSIIKHWKRDLHYNLIHRSWHWMKREKTVFLLKTWCMEENFFEKIIWPLFPVMIISFYWLWPIYHLQKQMKTSICFQ